MEYDRINECKRRRFQAALPPLLKGTIEMEKTKIAVIGYGGQGKWHCGQLLKSDVAVFAGVYDIDPVKQQQAKGAGIHTYASFEEVLGIRV